MKKRYIFLVLLFFIIILGFVFYSMNKSTILETALNTATEEFGENLEYTTKVFIMHMEESKTETLENYEISVSYSKEQNKHNLNVILNGNSSDIYIDSDNCEIRSTDFEGISLEACTQTKNFGENSISIVPLEEDAFSLKGKNNWDTDVLGVIVLVKKS